jgi:RecB family exonuclease
MNMSTRLFTEALEAEVADTTEAEPDTRRWSVAGRGKRKATPDGEDGKWWRANGPPMVESWITWRRKVAWKVWTTPDGTPAIELSQEFVTPKGRQIKGFIDRVFVIPGGELVIVDLKSGARSPESDLQLAFYRYCLYNTFGVDVRHGAYWMARTGELSEIYNLTRISPALMAVWMARFDKAIDNEIFIPNVSFKCRACSHRDYCVAFGGSKAHLDPDSQIEEAAA